MSLRKKSLQSIRREDPIYMTTKQLVTPYLTHKKPMRSRIKVRRHSGAVALGSTCITVFLTLMNSSGAV